MKLFNEQQSRMAYELLVVVAIMLLAIIFQLHRVINHEVELAEVSFSIAGMLPLLGFAIYYAFNQRITTLVTHQFVEVKKSPWLGGKHQISLNDIDTVAVVQTPQALQWMGDNVAFGPEHFFSLNGHNGIALRTRDGHQYFIGSQRPDELAEVIDQAARF